ncbi:hypothetical protein D3C71_1954040 [compost metagenome]
MNEQREQDENAGSQQTDGNHSIFPKTVQNPAKSSQLHHCPGNRAEGQHKSDILRCEGKFMIDEQSEHRLIIGKAEGHDEHNNQPDKIRLPVRAHQLGDQTFILLLSRRCIMDSRSNT